MNKGFPTSSLTANHTDPTPKPNPPYVCIPASTYVHIIATESTASQHASPNSLPSSCPTQVYCTPNPAQRLSSAALPLLL
jgi:hypothetical protein